jgi:hypothetical protein
MYLDFEETEKPLALTNGHRQHVGKTGLFVPVLENGGVLYRVKDDKSYAVTGTKGYFWLEAEVAKNIENLKIDMSYFDDLVAEAIEAIDYYGPFADFVR